MTRIEYVPPQTAPPQHPNGNQSAYIPAYREAGGERYSPSPTPPNMPQPPAPGPAQIPYQQQPQQPPRQHPSAYPGHQQPRDGQPEMANGVVPQHRGGNISMPPPASMNPGNDPMGASQRGRKYRQDEPGRHASTPPIPSSMTQTQIAQQIPQDIHHHHGPPPSQGYGPPAPPRSSSAMVPGQPPSQMDHPQGPPQHHPQQQPHHHQQPPSSSQQQQQQQPRGREGQGWYEDAPTQPDMRGFPQDQGHHSRSRGGGRQNPPSQGGEEMSDYHYLTAPPTHATMRDGALAISGPPNDSALTTHNRLHHQDGYQDGRRQHGDDGNQGGFGREPQGGARHQGYQGGYPDAGPQQQQQPPPPPQEFGAPARPCTRKGHENYLCDVYCDVDQQHVCLLCLRRDDNHKQHKCNAVRVPPPEFRQSVTDWIQHAKVQQADIQETTRTLERTATQIQQDTEDEIQTLSETVEDLKRRLDISKKKLSDQAREATKQEVAKLRELQAEAQGHASKIDQAVAEVRKINANSTLAEVVHLKKFIALTAFEKQEQRVPLRIVKFRAHNTLNSDNLLQMAPKTEEMVIAPSTNPLNSRITSEVKVQGVDYELFQKNLA